MARIGTIAFASLLVLCSLFVAQASLLGDDYCSDSVFDPKMTSATTYYRQKGLFQESYATFAQWTRNSNLTDNSTLTALADRLLNLVPAYTQVDAQMTGWTITRSSGIIIIDTNSAPAMVYPAIENHNTRYEFAKAMQCRDHGAPVVFEKYWIPRLSRTSQFFGKAIQTGSAGEWFVFRINFKVPA
jgi:hypothetical protein